MIGTDEEPRLLIETTDTALHRVKVGAFADRLQIEVFQRPRILRLRSLDAVPLSVTVIPFRSITAASTRIVRGVWQLDILTPAGATAIRGHMEDIHRLGQMCGGAA